VPLDLRVHARKHPLEVAGGPMREEPRNDSQIVTSHIADTTPRKRKPARMIPAPQAEQAKDARGSIVLRTWIP
jgi:hypothetical protein